MPAPAGSALRFFDGATRAEHFFDANRDTPARITGRRTAY
jgi:hypothetical protein